MRTTGKLPAHRMFGRLLALFVIVPALELYLLVKLGTLIGAAETFGIILLTGLVGSYLAKSQGLSVWRRFQAKMAGGSIPGSELLDGVIVLLSGALLITPGILTDVVGFLGLIPVTRSYLRKYLKSRILPSLTIRGMQSSRFGATFTNNGFTNSGFPEQGVEGNPSRSTSAKNGQSSDPDVIIRGTPKRRPSRPEDGTSS